MGYSCSYIIKVVCVVLFILVVGSSKNTKCPFEYVYHFGDGVTDIGNSVRILPWGPLLPPATWPYGTTFPGRPNGRWSDGLIDFDFAGVDFGFPDIVPYLSRKSKSSNGVIFSVARSPVLDHNFFKSRGVKIPPYAVPLSRQITWFKSHLKSICTTKAECANKLGNSLILMGDIEGNDIGYPLVQGKSIQQLQTDYVPYVIKAQIKATKELIKMGAKLLIVPGNSPIGCYPYILTALHTNDPTAYDDLGCLKSVNDLITLKNNYLQQALKVVAKEFRNVSIYYGPFGDGVRIALEEASKGPNGKMTLKACCGVGGKYNYNSKRFCGSPGVHVCSNPDDYIFWDGLHLTHNASARIESILVRPALSTFNCTS